MVNAQTESLQPNNATNNCNVCEKLSSRSALVMSMRRNNAEMFICLFCWLARLIQDQGKLVLTLYFGAHRTCKNSELKKKQCASLKFTVCTHSHCNLPTKLGDFPCVQQIFQSGFEELQGLQPYIIFILFSSNHYYPITPAYPLYPCTPCFL